MTVAKKEKTKYRYVVVSVYNENDGCRELVHFESSWKTPDAAFRAASRLARLVFDSAKRGRLVHKDVDFEDVYEKVDNGERGLFMDWGYDPVDGMALERIRVAKMEE